MMAFVRGYFPAYIFQAMARKFSSINTSLEKDCQLLISGVALSSVDYSTDGHVHVLR